LFQEKVGFNYKHEIKNMNSLDEEEAKRIIQSFINFISSASPLAWISHGSMIKASEWERKAIDMICHANNFLNVVNSLPTISYDTVKSVDEIKNLLKFLQESIPSAMETYPQALGLISQIEERLNGIVFSNVIVCSSCGNRYRFSSEDKLCEHQKKLIEEIRTDPGFKKW